MVVRGSYYRKITTTYLLERGDVGDCRGSLKKTQKKQMDIIC